MKSIINIIILAFVALVVGIIFTKGKKGLFRLFNAASSESDNDAEMFQLIEEDIKQDELTLTDSEIAKRANDAFNAMDDPGTDESGLRQALQYSDGKFLNESDMKAVYVKFGVRPEIVFGVPFFPRDLKQWVKSESQGDLSDILEIFKQYGL